MTGSSNKDVVAFTITAFVAGICASTLYQKYIEKKKKSQFARKNAGAYCEKADLSLFYSTDIVSPPDIESLTTITQDRKFLPGDFYRHMVQNCVIFCVDVLVLRKNPVTKKPETLLVFRADDPVKGVWWWPGGRMFKGETFFSCAMRKLRQETGLTSDEATPVQVLGVWNTFFPTSAWDDDKAKGTQTVNVIVLVELPDELGEVKLDKTCEKNKWVPVDSKEAEKNGEIDYVLEGMRRYEAWRETYGEL